MRRSYRLLTLIAFFSLSITYALGQVPTSGLPDAQAVTPATGTSYEQTLQPTAVATTETRVRRTDNTEAPYRDDSGKWGLAGLLGLFGLAGLRGRRNERVLVNRTLPTEPSGTVPPRRNP
jgi:MYXO-CTERM domain-containing protein